MSYRKLIWLLSLLLLLAYGCAKPKQENKDRYVVLSPEIAEILCALGAASDIVGVTDECTYPAELHGIESVGKFGALDREKIISLKPTVIFSSALEQEAIASEFSKLGFRVESYYPKSLDSMIMGIREIGGIVDKHNEMLALTDSLLSFISRTRKQTAGQTRPRVYIEIYRDPLMSASDQSFVGELIELAGGDNVFPTLERDYSRVKAEDVINSNPDVIICYSQDTLASILSRKGWQNIPAIKNKQIYFEKDIEPDLIQRAGPRIVQGVTRLREIFAIAAGAKNF
ncbi:MAG TPA: cobalamin-binding protein [Candidatus Cloacimonadota bacterium]|nr:cobalamin-binding protein [Candidatus Cloacimonadota bacterium]HPS37861.1 cobalamin-binding protein [Candidatus Cloacimonadota bacterium]